MPSVPMEPVRDDGEDAAPSGQHDAKQPAEIRPVLGPHGAELGQHIGSQRVHLGNEIGPQGVHLRRKAIDTGFQHGHAGFQVAHGSILTAPVVRV